MFDHWDFTMTSLRRSSFPVLTPAPIPPAPQPVDHGAVIHPHRGLFELDAPMTAEERSWLDADISQADR